MDAWMQTLEAVAGFLVIGLAFLRVAVLIWVKVRERNISRRINATKNDGDPDRERS